MALTLPYPSAPTNGQALDATPILANETAIAQAIQSFDGSQVQAGTIQGSALAASINPNLLLHDTEGPFVSSGCVWSATSGLAAAMSSGVAYVNNVSLGQMYRTAVSSVASNTFAASSDTYVDVDYLGNLYYSATSIGGTAPAITANSMRLAIVRTNGSVVTNVFQPPVGPYGTPVSNFILTSESTSSITYTDLATAGPICVARVGPKGMLKIDVSSYMYTTAVDWIYISVNAAFDNLIGTADYFGPAFKAANGANDHVMSYTRTLYGLNPGVTWVELRYRVGSGTGTFGSRSLTITGF